MHSFLIYFFTKAGERFNELILGSIDWIFLLEECIDIIFLRLGGGIFLNVNWIL